MQETVRQRTPLQLLSPPSLNTAPRYTFDAPLSNELHPTATAVPVHIETVDGVVTPNHGAQASFVGNVRDDDSDDLARGLSSFLNSHPESQETPPETQDRSPI